MTNITTDWATALSEEFTKPYYQELSIFIADEYAAGDVFPPKEDIFAAFNLTPLERVKCVIIGQDPYHGEGQAEGLSFSVKPGVPLPPSLVNIYKELNSDLGADVPNHGSLVKWAKEGVLLLNAVLTVRAHQANSHQGMGWEKFTDACIKALNEVDRPIVFILWGAYAGKKEKMLTNPKHMIIKSPHPSPLSSYRGFFGSKPFSRTNEFLVANGVEPIEWAL